MTIDAISPATFDPDDQIACPSCGQDNEFQREFCWACSHRFGTPVAVKNQSEEETREEPRFYLDAIDSPRSEDMFVDWGSPVKMAYKPSGKPGQTSVLFLQSLLGFLIGLFKGAVLLALAVGLNLIHNLLPVFFFIMPVLIVGLMLAAPFVVGMTVGSNVGSVVAQARCRIPGQAGRIAVIGTLGGLILFLTVAQLATSPGESFLFDWLLWFVRIMVGGTLSFTWLAEPEPLAAAWEGVILALLGLSTILGLVMAYITAAEVVRSVPFCERCQKLLTPKYLWSVAPAQAERTMRALQSLNFEKISKIPRCTSFDNFVSVDLWACSCDSAGFLELVGYGVEPAKGRDDEPTTQDPARIFSRPLTPEQVQRLPE